MGRRWSLYPINRMMPITSTLVRGDEIDQQPAQLGISAPPIPRSISFSGRRLDLTPQEHQKLAQLSGGYVNERLQDVDMTGEPDELRVELTKAIRRGRAEAHREFVSELMDAPGMAQRFAQAKIRPGTVPSNPFEEGRP